MTEEDRNCSLWMSILFFPFFVALILTLLFKTKELCYLFLVGPLGCSIFHFRGKVFYRHWYSKAECIIFGIGWFILAVLIFRKIIL